MFALAYRAGTGACPYNIDNAISTTGSWSMIQKQSILLRAHFLLFAVFCFGLGGNYSNTLAASPSKQEVQTMTLAEAVTLALRHSRTVENAYLDRLLEKFDLKIAQDKFSPDFSVFSSASQGNTEGESSYSTEVGGEAVLKVPTGGEFSLT
ncbi:hypothetical protein KKHLCK_10040 [Candidatus Electrothrix laxa]